MSSNDANWDECSNNRVQYAREEFHKAEGTWNERLAAAVASYNLSDIEREELLRRLG